VRKNQISSFEDRKKRKKSGKMPKLFGKRDGRSSRLRKKKVFSTHLFLGERERKSHDARKKKKGGGLTPLSIEKKRRYVTAIPENIIKKKKKAPSYGRRRGKHGIVVCSCK